MRTQYALNLPDRLRENLKPNQLLSVIVGSETQTRAEIVKKLWAYIKSNKLQSRINKRMVKADKNLLPLFKRAEVSMFDLAKIVNENTSIE